MILSSIALVFCFRYIIIVYLILTSSYFSPESPLFSNSKPMKCFLAFCQAIRFWIRGYVFGRLKIQHEEGSNGWSIYNLLLILEHHFLISWQKLIINSNCILSSARSLEPLITMKSIFIFFYFKVCFIVFSFIKYVQIGYYIILGMG